MRPQISRFGLGVASRLSASGRLCDEADVAVAPAPHPAPKFLDGRRMAAFARHFYRPAADASKQTRAAAIAPDPRQTVNWLCRSPLVGKAEAKLFFVRSAIACALWNIRRTRGNGNVLLQLRANPRLGS